MADGIHRPDEYGAGAVAERHAAALARARAERGDRPGPRKLSADELTEEMLRRGQRNAAVRAAVRADLGDTSWEDRRDAQVARVNAAHALMPLIQRFEDYLPAQLGAVPEVVEWASGAAAGDDDWLVILGPTGVGKTWQAVAAYRAVTHDLGAEGQAISATELFARSLPSAPDRLNLAVYRDTDVLLLDDLTAELSEWDRKVLFQLIDARSARNRLTILTSNLRREELRPALGERMVSRVNHRMRLVLMGGPDRRLLADDAPEVEPDQRLPYKD